MDQPVVPTYPTTWPRCTCSPTFTIAGPDMWLVMVASPTPWWKPWSMITRLPQAVWKYFSTTTPEAAAWIGVPHAAPKSTPSCSDR